VTYDPHHLISVDCWYTTHRLSSRYMWHTRSCQFVYLMCWLCFHSFLPFANVREKDQRPTNQQQQKPPLVLSFQHREITRGQTRKEGHTIVDFIEIYSIISFSFKITLLLRHSCDNSTSVFVDLTQEITHTATRHILPSWVLSTFSVGKICLVPRLPRTKKEERKGNNRHSRQPENHQECEMKRATFLDRDSLEKST